MENRENKILAQKLGSLQTLPEGYSPNLSSKWELVQAAMEQRNHKARNRKIAAVLFLMIVAGLATWSLSFRHPAIEEAPKTAPIRTRLRIQQPTAPVPQRIQPSSLKPKRITIIKTVNVLPPVAKKDSVFLLPTLVQPPPPSTDTVQQRRDTLRAVAPVARRRPKARIYQRDFEGIATSTDTVNTKTATKSFLKFNPHKAEESSPDWKPALRILQNF